MPLTIQRPSQDQRKFDQTISYYINYCESEVQQAFLPELQGLNSNYSNGHAKFGNKTVNNVLETNSKSTRLN